MCQVFLGEDKLQNHIYNACKCIYNAGKLYQKANY